MNRKIFYLLFLLFSIGLHAEQIKIKTDPTDAMVYIRDLNGNQNIKLGASPYEGNLSELATSFAKSNFFLIVVEKVGYETQTILVSDLFKSDLDIKLNLTPKEDVLHYRKLDKTISEVFEAQRLMRAGQYDDAISSLKNVEVEQPKLSIVPEFIGAAYYLKKDLKGSLAWYEKAYRMNPENKDAYTMKTYLRKALGSDEDKK